MSLRIGTLRHRVNIERRGDNTTLDTRGQLAQAFDIIARRVVCSIRQLSNDEGTLARQTFPTATHTVEMRWRSGMTSKDRLTFGSRTLSVLGIENVDERNRELILTCGEEV